MKSAVGVWLNMSDHKMTKEFMDYIRVNCRGISNAMTINDIMFFLDWDKRKEDFQILVLSPLKKTTGRIGSCHAGVYYIDDKSVDKALRFYEHRIAQELSHMKVIANEFQKPMSESIERIRMQTNETLELFE